ncbi:GAL4-like Zn(II)2Cys6 (or C6 zinc) binuclear cluster DNA-binding domain, partial [Rhizoctonia solani]
MALLYSTRHTSSRTLVLGILTSSSFRPPRSILTMNTFLSEHSGQDSPASFNQGMYDWHSEHLPASQAPYSGVGMQPGYSEHEFTMASGPQFQYNPSMPLQQRPSFGVLPPANDVDYRGSSPHSAPPSGGNSPWSTGSVPAQEVMYHPDIEISKFNRGSRGSMNSLSLTSMRTSHALSNGHAYTSKMGMRPHALSVSNMGPNEEQPWNLIPCSMPFAQDGVGSTGIPGVAGTSFFLRSPTPTKRQRTNQACEKCRERKAKCNGARPTCQRCAARGHICEYAKERRMRGPNKTGRRGSQADIEDPIDSPGRPATSLDLDVSETTGHRDESPASSRPGSRRSSSEVAQGEPGSLSASKSTSGSPEPQLRSGASAPISLPILSNGNLSLAQYRTDSSAARHPVDAQRTPSESVIRYAQSMPQIGRHYGQPHDGFAEVPAGVWNHTGETQTATGLGISEHRTREDAVSSDFPSGDIQTLHYSVSDVSSSSTPITPDRFDYAWPSDNHSPQQNTFAYVHNDKSMLPIPEFEGESNSLGELPVWESGKHPIIVTSVPKNDQQNL